MRHSEKTLDYRFDLLSSQSEEEHFHQDVELLYVLHGRVEVFIEENRCILSAEDLLLINLNKRHRIGVGEEALACQIRIPYALLNRYTERDHVMFWCNTTQDSSEHHHTLRVLLRQMLNCKITHPDRPNPMLTSYFYELLNCLLEHFLVDSSDERVQQEQNKFDGRMNEIISFIEENYAEHVSLNDLADRLHLTYSYLSRHFKKVFGVNFLEYVNRIRLRHAVEDLLYTDKPITRIAVDNGYVNASSLNKAFQETYHMAPTAYKKKMRSVQTEDDRDGRIARQEALYQQAKEYLSKTGVEERQRFSVQRYTVRADGTKKEPYHKNWLEVINIGRASDLLKAKVQEQTLLLRDTLGFRAVRFWSVFSEEMELRPGHKTDLINFDRLDEVLDFLVYNNLTPFIELGDKPFIISQTTTEILRLDNGRPIFCDLPEYRRLLEQFFHHIITRYRAERVRQWRFECWYDDRKERQAEPVSYFEIFNTTCEVMRGILPDAVIGGCGFKCNDVEMEKFLRTWMQQPFQPDFFSVMVYPYEPSEVYSSSGNTNYTRLSADSQFIKHQITRTRELLQKVGMEVPLYVTEWNCTISSRNYLNDTCYRGTYVLKNIIDTLDQVDVMSQWVGSDLLSTYYDSKNILTGCPGLLTKDGICKPAYYAYLFLRRMGAYLVQMGENYMITASGHFSYYIICLNYHQLNYHYYHKPENTHTVKEILDLSENNSVIRINFQLDNLPDDRYEIKTSAISPHYGSVLNEWVRLNAMTNIRQEDINYLKRICTPHMSIQEMDTRAGQLRFEIELEPEEFALIHIYHKI